MNIQKPSETDRELIMRIKLRLRAMEAYAKAALDHVAQLNEMIDLIEKRKKLPARTFMDYDAN